MGGIQELSHQSPEELVTALPVGIGQSGARDRVHAQRGADPRDPIPELHQVTQATYTTEVTQQKHEEMVASVETPALEVGAEGVDRILDQGVRHLAHDLKEECGSLLHGLRLLAVEVVV